jgi:hypothetical protein
MAKYRKRPVEVEAVKFNGSSTDVGRITCWMETGKLYPLGMSTCDFVSMVIPTLEGDMTVQPGDFVIRGVAGEFYPCKPEIFAATYELVEEWN